MSKLSLIVASFGLLMTASVPAYAAACRDAKGKFTKCPDKAPSARCKDAKGRFAKCTAPGAKPA